MSVPLPTGEEFFAAVWGKILSHKVFKIWIHAKATVVIAHHMTATQNTLVELERTGLLEQEASVQTILFLQNIGTTVRLDLEPGSSKNALLAKALIRAGLAMLQNDLEDYQRFLEQNRARLSSQGKLHATATPDEVEQYLLKNILQRLPQPAIETVQKGVALRQLVYDYPFELLIPLG